MLFLYSDEDLAELSREWDELSAKHDNGDTDAYEEALYQGLVQQGMPEELASELASRASESDTDDWSF